LALQGKGAAFLPEPVVGEDLAQGRLTRIATEPIFSQSLWLSSPGAVVRDPGLRAVLNHMMTRYQLDAGAIRRPL
jgi:DNA-binding transcriptional LysR family regulator